MSKISKNIKMLDILSSGKIYNKKKLSEMLEVSPRTVRQYKDELEKEGIYVELNRTAISRNYKAKFIDPLNIEN